MQNMLVIAAESVWSKHCYWNVSIRKTQQGSSDTPAPERAAVMGAETSACAWFNVGARWESGVNGPRAASIGPVGPSVLVSGLQTH